MIIKTFYHLKNTRINTYWLIYKEDSLGLLLVWARYFEPYISSEIVLFFTIIIQVLVTKKKKKRIDWYFFYQNKKASNKFIAYSNWLK